MLLPMIREHWNHIALFRDEIPLAPDWDKYAAMEKAGVFHPLLAWKDKLPVGYIWLLVGPGLHYKETLTAVVDVFWLAPSARRGLAAGPAYRKLIRGAEAYAQSLGARRFTVNYKVDHNLASLFFHLGYAASDIVVTKLLEPANGH